VLDRLLAVYGFNDGPETRDEMEQNDLAVENAQRAFRLARKLRALNPQARALVVEYAQNGETE
jgi:hypothetical protein